MFSSATRASMSFWNIPMNRPPMMLISVIRIDAHRVALSKPDGAIHGAVEVGFLADARPPFARFFLIDDPGVEIRIDRELLSR